ncbi:hypothetical protein VTO42DRAFT_3899 [Malbranchea cinnamomea]
MGEQSAKSVSLVSAGRQFVLVHKARQASFAQFLGSAGNFLSVHWSLWVFTVASYTADGTNHLPDKTDQVQFHTKVGMKSP